MRYFGEGFVWTMTHRKRCDRAFAAGEEPADPRMGGSWLLHGVDPHPVPVRAPRPLLDQHVIAAGTTGCGKTRLLELLALQAIREGETVVIIDPKGDTALLDRVFRAAQLCGREGQFRFFSPLHPEQSVTYNPLHGYGQVREIADRIAALLPSGPGNAPFRNFAWDVVYRVAQATRDAGLPMTLAQIRRGIEGLDELASKLPSHRAEPVRGLLAHPRDHLLKMTSSLGPILTRLTGGSLRKLLSPAEPELTWSDGSIVYFYLGSMIAGESAQTIAKLALLDLQAQIGRRYASGGAPMALLVDEFSDLAMPEFVSVLNKSRGAGVSITLATQTLSDLEASLGSEARAMQILANASTLVQFRTGSEQDAQMFGRLAGREPTSVVSTGQSYEPALLSSGSKYVDDFRAVFSTQTQIRDEDLLPAHFATRLANLHAFARIGGVLYKIQIPVVNGRIERPFSEGLK